MSDFEFRIGNRPLGDFTQVRGERREDGSAPLYFLPAEEVEQLIADGVKIDRDRVPRLPDGTCIFA